MSCRCCWIGVVDTFIRPKILSTKGVSECHHVLQVLLNRCCWHLHPAKDTINKGSIGMSPCPAGVVESVLLTPSSGQRHYQQREYQNVTMSCRCCWIGVVDTFIRPKILSTKGISECHHVLQVLLNRCCWHLHPAKDSINKGNIGMSPCPAGVVESVLLTPSSGQRYYQQREYRNVTMSCRCCWIGVVDTFIRPKILSTKGISECHHVLQVLLNRCCWHLHPAKDSINKGNIGMSPCSAGVVKSVLLTPSSGQRYYQQREYRNVTMSCRCCWIGVVDTFIRPKILSTKGISECHHVLQVLLNRCCWHLHPAKDSINKGNIRMSPCPAGVVESVLLTPSSGQRYYQQREYRNVTMSCRCCWIGVVDTFIRPKIVSTKGISECHHVLQVLLNRCCWHLHPAKDTINKGNIRMSPCPAGVVESVLLTPSSGQR